MKTLKLPGRHSGQGKHSLSSPLTYLSDKTISVVLLQSCVSVTVFINKRQRNWSLVWSFEICCNSLERRRYVLWLCAMLPSTTDNWLNPMQS